MLTSVVIMLAEGRRVRSTQADEGWQQAGGPRGTPGLGMCSIHGLAPVQRPQPPRPGRTAHPVRAPHASPPQPRTSSAVPQTPC